MKNNFFDSSNNIESYSIDFNYEYLYSVFMIIIVNPCSIKNAVSSLPEIHISI